MSQIHSAHFHAGIFRNIHRIIEQDSKSTTYKFALLRGVIDIINENSPHIITQNNRVFFPTGLLIEKWMLYYYPLMESKTNIPQINGGANLAFEEKLHKIISFYRDKGSLSVFYNDLRNEGIHDEIAKDFLSLVKQLRTTITTMPMKYLGQSVYKRFYSVFEYQNGSCTGTPSNINIEFLISNFGTFSIPLEYYEAFKIFGSFISGQDSILFKWAEFSANASGQRLSVENIVHEVLKPPITNRDILEAKKLYCQILQKEGNVHCVWTGKRLTKYDIDHVIPFSLYKNNDLWNLLPASSAVNRQKSDRIPVPEFIEKRSDSITYYWNVLNESFPERFSREIRVALLGDNPMNNWQSDSLSQLQQTCDYLISVRGFEAWKI